MTESKQRQLIRLALEKLEPSVRDAFAAAIARAKGRINAAELVALLDEGRLDEAAALVVPTDAELSALRETIRGGFVVGGQVPQHVFPASAPLGRFYFDMGHPRAEAWVKSHVGEMIEDIQRDTLAMTREVIEDGLSEGLSTAKLARSITGTKVGSTRQGGFLGLNSVQKDSIKRARRLLSSGNPGQMADYLDLALRDRRFDAMIKSAIKVGEPITGDRLEQILAAHRTKALGYRGKVIAKQEARSAIHAGNAEGWRQALDRPDVEAVTKRWIHGQSKEPRLDHVAMNGTVIGLDEKFAFDDEELDRPHDDGASAEHTMGCNCSLFYRVIFKVI